ncbi:Aste57867_1587 [Aphanomyces stellatus]|uniref:Aste57867_1587 protein n=1 Tax=Aphanomyces stellatus TaxID=120398 RepID=A0A485K5G2_9STRA|nr:hypothetical protein As57867_001586 [Aphanomyces stellatus]VFT78800.1 Aste57867_1587 [Aphanomyces stellatus]
MPIQDSQSQQPETVQDPSAYQDECEGWVTKSLQLLTESKNDELLHGAWNEHEELVQETEDLRVYRVEMESKLGHKQDGKNHLDSDEKELLTKLDDQLEDYNEQIHAANERIDEINASHEVDEITEMLASEATLKVEEASLPEARQLCMLLFKLLVEAKTTEVKKNVELERAEFQIESLRKRLRDQARRQVHSDMQVAASDENADTGSLKSLLPHASKRVVTLLAEALAERKDATAARRKSSKMQPKETNKPPSTKQQRPREPVAAPTEAEHSVAHEGPKKGGDIFSRLNSQFTASAQSKQRQTTNRPTKSGTRAPFF